MTGTGEFSMKSQGAVLALLMKVSMRFLRANNKKYPKLLWKIHNNNNSSYKSSGVNSQAESGSQELEKSSFRKPSDNTAYKPVSTSSEADPFRKTSRLARSPVKVLSAK
ncbi:uncharacterized protein LOC128923131 [Zeugodacus cucurbitae]|uniref:uncharacterized protein LOC128923131 n=1 Tax=Zeugodacus cucurbitae TaxID=28588 RepID=UPI0023D94F52|nr:uncharacterized protein LOC128923131 [Zeugodacus cucurbitae]